MMRELSNNEVETVAGGKLPDEDLQDMRDKNPDAKSWHEIINSPPPE